MEIIEKDILTIERGIIGHQVNCQGVMGAGLASAIAKKWPVVKENYLGDLYSEKHLGDISWADVSAAGDSSLKVASLFGQNSDGRDGKCYTDYSGLSLALHRLQHAGDRFNQPIYLPYGLGCGLAGGDWEVVERMIRADCWSAVVCKLPEAGQSQ